MYEPTYEKVFEVSRRYLHKWKELYPDSQETMPRNMMNALSKCVVIKYYVDDNHVGNMANKTSNSGIIIYVNNEPMSWYSKHRNTVGDSSFGSDFVSLRIATYMNEALRYKLRCFEVPLDGTT